MARPACPKPILREKGPRCHPSTLPFPTASASNSKTQHSSQLALIPHTLSPIHTLLSQPIQFVKTQTISGTLAECQTVLSLGYFCREMGRKRSLASAEGEAVKRVRRKSSTNNVNSRDLGGDELLDQPQPVSERKVVGEVSVGKTTPKTPARKIKLPQPGKSTIPPKDKKNKPNKELANTTLTKSKANGGATSKPVPGSQKKIIKKNGLKDVPHLPESGVPSGQSTGSTVLLPDGATAPGMTIVERDSTSKSQFKNLKLSTGSIANTSGSGKTVVSGTSNPDRKPEALSERYSGEYPDKQRVKGIRNRSAFCYRNSVLQLLASSEVCVQEMIGHVEMHIEESCRCGPNCVSCALGKFFQNHFTSAGKKQNENTCISLVAQLCKVLPYRFGLEGNQEDTSEYLLALLNKGMDQLNSAQETNSEENHFGRVFGAKYDSILTCRICKNQSVTPEHQLSLQLTPEVTTKATINLKACFTDIFSGEDVEASCDNCGHKATLSDKSKCFSKKTEIRKLPKFLIITISRYSINDSGVSHKIMNPVKVEEKLVLEEGDKDVTYQLTGMISHKGGELKCGHYIAFIKQPDLTWAKCDDSKVKQTDLEQIESQQNTFQIYMLGYEQVTR